MTPPAPTKPPLRAALLAARAARSTESIARARGAVVSVVMARWTTSWDCVAAYEPLRTEPGSPELLAALRGRGSRVIVPVLLPDGDLDWREWPAALGRSGLLGPDAIRDAALVLVPALAVDRRGIRLGRGGGSYDRALARLGARPGAPGDTTPADTAPADTAPVDTQRGRIPVAALLYDGEHLEQDLPSDPWDRPVDDVITPSGWRAASSPTVRPAGRAAVRPAAELTEPRADPRARPGVDEE